MAHGLPFSATVICSWFPAVPINPDPWATTHWLCVSFCWTHADKVIESATAPIHFTHHLLVLALQPATRAAGLPDSLPPLATADGGGQSGSRSTSTSALHLHNLIHGHHVVVQMRHDP